MPTGAPLYGSSVESWWASHPFNPESAHPIPLGGIASPANRIDVSPGVDLFQTVKAAPNGTTIHLAPGTYSMGTSSTGVYNLWARSGIHLVADQPGTVVLDFSKTVWKWFGCTAAQVGMPYSDTSGDFYAYFSAALSAHTMGALSCLANRPGNIYFHNLVFDGGGVQNSAANDFEVYNGVVFDSVTFQHQYNLRVLDPSAFHDGQVNTIAWTDNVWVRGSTFKGEAPVVVKFDGCHSCGLVWNTVYMSFAYGSAGGGGFGHWNNNDDSADIDHDGVINDETNERRKSQYIVAYGNTWVPGTVNEQASQSEASFVNGSHVLFARNTITAPIFWVARWVSEADNHNCCHIVETFRDYVVRENLSTSTVTAFWRPDSTCYQTNTSLGNTCDISGEFPAGSNSNISSYTVTGNVVTGGLQYWVWNNCTNVADSCAAAWPNGTLTQNCQGPACALPPPAKPYP